MIIGISKLVVECTIGLLPHEKLKKQEIWIDVKLDVKKDHQMERESIDHTIDYTKIAEICRQTATSYHYLLVETLAEDLITIFFERFPIQSASITVKKPAAIQDADYSYVELFKTLDNTDKK